MLALKNLIVAGALLLGFQEPRKLHDEGGVVWKIPHRAGFRVGFDVETGPPSIGLYYWPAPQPWLYEPAWLCIWLDNGTILYGPPRRVDGTVFQ